VELERKSAAAFQRDRAASVAQWRESRADIETAEQRIRELAASARQARESAVAQQRSDAEAVANAQRAAQDTARQYARLTEQLDERVREQEATLAVAVADLEEQRAIAADAQREADRARARSIQAIAEAHRQQSVAEEQGRRSLTAEQARLDALCSRTGATDRVTYTYVRRENAARATSMGYDPTTSVEHALDTQDRRRADSYAGLVGGSTASRALFPRAEPSVRPDGGAHRSLSVVDGAPGAQHHHQQHHQQQHPQQQPQQQPLANNNINNINNSDARRSSSASAAAAAACQFNQNAQLGQQQIAPRLSDNDHNQNTSSSLVGATSAGPRLSATTTAAASQPRPSAAAAAAPSAEPVRLSQYQRRMTRLHAYRENFFSSPTQPAVSGAPPNGRATVEFSPLPSPLSSSRASAGAAGGGAAAGGGGGGGGVRRA
jgi:hypothetical protein